MEIFIILTKYNTRQWREEGKPLLVVYYLVNILLPHNHDQCTCEDWDMHLNVQRYLI